MALTKEQQKELERRNAKIYKRYCNMSEKQPLATDYKIFSILALEFELTTNMIALIVRTAQKEKKQ